jgi:hypothetical protein
MEPQEQEPEQQPKEQEQRTLFPRSPHTTGSAADDSSNSMPSTTATTTATTSTVTKVTPCRTSSRSRRKAVHKTDRLTPTSSKPNHNKFRKRHPDNETANVDDDEFYSFKPLIALLTKEWNWVYRAARDRIHAWVYLRPGKDEKNGNLLEDFFYEEHQVVDYCKANNYKQLYQQWLHDSRPNDDEEETKDDETSCITPSPRKKRRSTPA